MTVTVGVGGGERTVTVTMPRCGKCAAGKHGRCEHPRHIEGYGDGSVATCCCVTAVTP